MSYQDACGTMKRMLGQPLVAALLLAAVVFFAALGLLVVQTVWIEARSIRPPRYPVNEIDPALSPFRVGSVSFDTSDGITLRGWYIPGEGRAAIALVHGFAGTRQQLAREAALFASRGYGVLLYDARAHGESGGDRTTFGDLERRDLRAAVDFLVAQGAARVGLLGFSAGATAVAMAAAEDARVSAVALVAPTTSLRDYAWDESGRLAAFRAPVVVATMRYYGIDVDAIQPVRAVAQLAPRALLVIHGELDAVIPASRGRAVFAAAREPKQLLLLPTAGHGDFMESADYGGTLLSFFDGHLRTQPAVPNEK